MKKKSILIFDAYNNFIRAYVANPSINTNGEPIGGIVGFLKIIQKYVKQYDPDLIFVCWDGQGGSQKRKSIFKDYKSGRSPVRLNRFSNLLSENQQDQNKMWQVQRIIEYFNNMPIIQLLCDHVEADDLIAYVCNFEEYSEYDKIIISNDKDFIQLVSDDVTLVRPTQDEILTPKTTVENYGIHPRNFCLAKSITGDESDNIEGIPGAGFKTLNKRFPMLSESKRVTLTTLLDHATVQVANQGKKPIKLYDSILNSCGTIEKNMTLICLGDYSMSGVCKDKILWNIDNGLPQFLKISVMRMMNVDNISCDTFTTLFEYFARVGNQVK